MVWGAIAGAAIGAVGAGIQGSKNRSAAKKLAKKQAALGTGAQTAEQQLAQEKANSLWASDQNKSNQMWANDQNRQNMLWSRDQNKSFNQTNSFGNTLGYDDQGNQVASFGAADQGTLDALRGKRDAAIGSMSTGFDVNGDVMNAYRNLQNPLLQQRQDAENARLAAMGLSTGSGSAWQNAQQALNDARTRADQSAILQGFQADQALRSSNRADIGALGGVENNLRSNTGQAAMPGVGTTTVGAPTIATPNSNLISGWNADQGMAMGNYNQNVAQNAGFGNMMGNLGGAVGGMDFTKMFGGGSTGGDYGFNNAPVSGSDANAWLASQNTGVKL